MGNEQSRGIGRSTLTGQIESYLLEVLGEETLAARMGAAAAGGVLPLLEHPTAVATYFPYTRTDPAPEVKRGSPSPPPTTKISVNEIDCVDAAIALAGTYGPSRVAVLNMANEWNCGGGWERTGGSQEEYLFRRTSLAASLWPRRRVDDDRWSLGSRTMGRAVNAAGVPDVFYPFTECAAILSPNVDVISDGSCRYVDAATRALDPARFPMALGVISIAAQDLRPRSYNRGVHFDPELTKQKFRSLLSVAAANNYRALVLGAIGCGAFKNPPALVAAIFKDLLNGEFKDVFDEVVFAVILSKTNLDAFQTAFPAKL